MTTTASPGFDRARAVADTVLFEGYLLYPYRASAPKNRLRWQFGVLSPAPWSEAGGGDPWTMDLSFLVQASLPFCLRGLLRFLQLRQRRIERVSTDTGAVVQLPSLQVGDRLCLSFDEGELREIPIEAELTPAREVRSAFHAPGSYQVELVSEGDGEVVQIVRDSLPLRGTIHLSCRTVLPAEGVHRVQLRLQNHTHLPVAQVPRDEAMRRSLLSTHLLLETTGGRLLSMTDPPDWAEAAARTCSNSGLFPTLVEEPGRPDVLLAAPLILPDHPQVAPESPGDLFDATEIDELLTLRTLTLTDEEKREVRATDRRAAEILDRVEASGAQTLQRLHGAFRAPPEIAHPPARWRAGERVRLRPGTRRTDAQDMFLMGRSATVESVLEDVDGRTCLAVTIDGQPGNDLLRQQGRFLYFYPDEVERA